MFYCQIFLASLFCRTYYRLLQVSGNRTCHTRKDEQGHSSRTTEVWITLVSRLFPQVSSEEYPDGFPNHVLSARYCNPDPRTSPLIERPYTIHVTFQSENEQETNLRNGGHSDLYSL